MEDAHYLYSAVYFPFAVAQVRLPLGLPAGVVFLHFTSRLNWKRPTKGEVGSAVWCLWVLGCQI